MKKLLILLLFLLLTSVFSQTRLTSHKISLKNCNAFNLNLPKNMLN